MARILDSCEGVMMSEGLGIEGETKRVFCMEKSNVDV